MSSQNNDDKKQKNKLDIKDLIIIVISAVALILLLGIIIVSRRHDRKLSEALVQNSNITAGDILVNNKGSYEYLELTEVSGDKWIELYNKGAETIDISGLEVFVSGKSVGTIAEDENLKKEDYYVIEIDANPGSGESNVLTIVDKDGKQILSLIVPKLSSEQSYGWTGAETNKWGYITPSKKKENRIDGIEYVKYDGISFSAPGGFYDDAFSLELSADEGETIYYTTDGTRPTKDSDVYESGITISNKSGSNYKYAAMANYNRLHIGYNPGTVDAGMIIRAIAVNSAGAVTKEASQSYYIGIRKDTDYLNIPVLSITTDPENLFDYEEGIYVAGKAREDAIIQDLSIRENANFLNGWKKQTKIEYFEPDKGKSFELNVDMSINEDDAVFDIQKGFEFDLKNADYTIFNGAGIIDYISDDGKVKLTQNYDDNTLKVRNYIVSSITENMDIGTLDCQPCVLFLDGEYWGLYNLNAYLDKKYIARHYGISNEDIIFHENKENVEEFNTFYSFVVGNDMSVEENYENLKSMMDIDNFIDYICLNIGMGNTEFYPRYGMAWRTVNTEGTGKIDGKWRFICGDMSDTIYLTDKQTPTINTYLQIGMQSDLLLQALLMNEDFCKTFKARMNNMISNVFTEEKYSTNIDEIVELIKKPALASYTRYYGKASDKSYTELVKNIRIFFEERPEYLKKYTVEYLDKGGNLEKARELLEEIEKKEKASKGTIGSDEETSDSDEVMEDGTMEVEEVDNEEAREDVSEENESDNEKQNGEEMQSKSEDSDISIITNQTDIISQEEEETDGDN
ncbi:CotH kinase family protein [Butyrivibrio sp. WCE2006]|uniref:CotH kinase family protein n=1 Tax=Butyrivibrio sp. WCE2006 TaxID=1410611 RepID=UPI0005D13C18|nr:CotH kinase family protein [Butyrivibrio sp. WCE2006]